MLTSAYRHGCLGVPRPMSPRKSKTSESLYTSSMPPPRMTSPERPGKLGSSLVEMVRSVSVVMVHAFVDVPVTLNAGPVSSCEGMISPSIPRPSSWIPASATQPACIVVFIANSK